MNVCLLTSGGDSQGMNSCLSELSKQLHKSNHKVFASMGGYQGLVRNQIRRIDSKEFENISHLGGSVLKCFRCPEFATKEGLQQSLQALKQYKIDAVIAIGGDGTFRGANRLSQNGIKVIGIPGTIDNDLTYTDFTLGYDSAVNNAVHFIDDVKETLSSSNRIGLFEVMGRNCNDIAVATAFATSADHAILDKENFDYKALVDKLRSLIWEGVESPCVIVRENILDIFDLAAKLQRDMKTECRANVLGYLQRGGRPSLNDRILARKFAIHAVKLLDEDKHGLAVGQVNDMVVAVPIGSAHNINNRRPNEVLSLIST